MDQAMKVFGKRAMRPVSSAMLILMAALVLVSLVSVLSLIMGIILVGIILLTELAE